MRAACGWRQFWGDLSRLPPHDRERRVEGDEDRHAGRRARQRFVAGRGGRALKQQGGRSYPVRRSRGLGLGHLQQSEYRGHRQGRRRRDRTRQVAVVSDRLTALAAGFATSAKIMISGAETGMVTIEGGYSRSRLPVIPIDDLPTVLAIDGEIGHVEISGADLLSLLSPLPAADTERTRFYLCRVVWQSG